jgi:hypothetical protein
MVKKSSPAEISLSRQEARRFFLSHHYLWPPRQLRGSTGVLEYLQRVGCIQFDPINVVGRNPDLVLQSRIANYKPQLLNGMLYEERSLLDGWDKLASIHPTKDWPYFQRFRSSLRKRFLANERAAPVHNALEMVKTSIRERGPLSSLDIEHEERLVWDWGVPMRAVRAAMDMLYSMGDLGIHHRVNTRRIFDLTENLIPKKIRLAPDPNLSDEDYADWHVLRRIGGLGLADSSGTDKWLGITGVDYVRGMKAPQRNAAVRRLHEKGKIIRVRVEGLPKEILYIRKQDLPTLEAAASGRQPQKSAAILGALDNAMWDRKLLRSVFDFNYTWEVYVPEPKRKYGYYVLPVLYGDHFVARFDPAYDKPSHTFTLQNWWWEAGVNKTDAAMLAAIRNCLKAFCAYLRTDHLILGEAIRKDRLIKVVTKGLT